MQIASIHLSGECASRLTRSPWSGSPTIWTRTQRSGADTLTSSTEAASGCSRLRGIRRTGSTLAGRIRSSRTDSRSTARFVHHSSVCTWGFHDRTGVDGPLHSPTARRRQNQHIGGAGCSNTCRDGDQFHDSAELIAMPTRRLPVHLLRLNREPQHDHLTVSRRDDVLCDVRLVPVWNRRSRWSMCEVESG